MLLVLLAMGMTGWLFAQNTKTNAKGSIEPYRLEVGYDRTVNLIFPYSIISVDRGSDDVIAQKAKGVENVLQLKAADTDFNTTNLTVITGEGALYSFLIDYGHSPRLTNIRIAEMVLPIETITILSDRNGNEAALLDVAKTIAAKKRVTRKPADKQFDVGMALCGIYIRGNIMYFQIELENSSNITYDVDQFRMYIRDRKKSKRTASQELEMEPLYIEGNVKTIKGRSRQTIVVAVAKFTIPDQKFLRVEIMERNGGRHLAFRLKNKHIVKAMSI